MTLFFSANLGPLGLHRHHTAVPLTIGMQTAARSFGQHRFGKLTLHAAPRAGCQSCHRAVSTPHVAGPTTPVSAKMQEQTGESWSFWLSAFGVTVGAREKSVSAWAGR